MFDRVTFDGGRSGSFRLQVYSCTTAAAVVLDGGVARTSTTIDELVEPDHAYNKDAS